MRGGSLNSRWLSHKRTDFFGWQAKLQRRIDSTEVKVLNPPRLGKKCVVLDIDYTIFDLGSSAERPEELARPHLHDFMKAV